MWRCPSFNKNFKNIESFPSVFNQMQLLISAYLVKLNPGRDTKQRLPWGSARCWYQWTKPPIQVFHLLKFVPLSLSYSEVKLWSILTILISYHNAWSNGWRDEWARRNGPWPSHLSFETLNKWMIGTCVRNQTIVNLVASFRCYQHPTCIVSNKSICNRRPWMQPQYWRTRMSSNLWKEDPDLQKKIQA